MPKFKIVFLFFLLATSTIIQASPITKGFSALKIYNYFEAKRLFEKSLKKEQAAASYGLSIIYFRNDNPFYNIDTAYKFIFNAGNSFRKLTTKTKTRYLKYNVTQRSIDSMKNEVHRKAFDVYKNNNSISDLNKFIERYPSAPQKIEAIELRNSIAFKEAKKKDTHQAYQQFINTYPASKEIPEAKERYEFTFFEASTKNNTLEEYEKYLEKRPDTPFLEEVENSIYVLSTPHGLINEYHNFIKKHGKNRNTAAAWHSIYTIYTADYKTESLVDFKLEYPDYPFSEVVNQEIELSQKELYGVRVNGKWGFADSTGKVAVPCTYEWVEDFSEGFAECGLNGKSGFINKAGKLMIPFVYDQVEPFKHGLSIVQQNSKYGIINKAGKLIAPFEYDEISEFSEGFATAVKQDKYGYLNEAGDVAIPLQYSKAGDFSEGLAAIELDGQNGFINSFGVIVITCKYDWVEKFNNGLAKVKAMKKFGIINKSGAQVLPCEYDLLGEFAEDAILVVNEGKYGFADKNGTVFIPLEYDYSGTSMLSIKFKNGWAVAEKNRKQGLIDKTGKYITPKDFNKIEPFSEDLAAVQRKDKWGYIDRKMKLQIQSKYLSAGNFIEGIAKVVDKSKKTGFINHSGKVAIDFLFDEAADFKNGLCNVIIEDKMGIIDYTGTSIIPCELDAITPVNITVLKLEKNSKMAYYNILTREYFWKEEGF
ncbi:MAG: WG repeat-containing protein [Bacteroidota bacterium]